MSQVFNRVVLAIQDVINLAQADGVDGVIAPSARVQAARAQTLGTVVLAVYESSREAQELASKEYERHLKEVSAEMQQKLDSEHYTHREEVRKLTEMIVGLAEGGLAAASRDVAEVLEKYHAERTHEIGGPA